MRPALHLAQSSGHADTFSIASVSVLVFPLNILSLLNYRMTRWAFLAPLLLLLGLFAHSVVSQEAEAEAAAPPSQASDGKEAEDEDSDWGLNSIRGGFESVGGYFDSMLEFMGGRDGVCQYRCRFGKLAALCSVWFRVRLTLILTFSSANTVNH